MSDEGKGKTFLLLASVAANIFLVAFVAGRLSSPGVMPAPLNMEAQRQQQMQQQMMAQAGMQQGGPENPGGPPDGFPRNAGGFDRPGGPGGPGGNPGNFGGPPQEQGSNMPPPPPLFGPGDLFGPQDMQQNMLQMRKNFDKAQSLQRNFAQRLEQGGISKEEVLKHFAEVDAVMNGVKNQVQEKAAEKISTMSEEERKQFATRLKQRGGQPGADAPPGQMPGMGGAQGVRGGMPGGQAMPGRGFPPGPGPGQPPGQFHGELGQGFGQGPEPGQVPPPR